jgi:hypothetical protein
VSDERDHAHPTPPSFYQTVGRNYRPPVGAVKATAAFGHDFLPIVW